MYRSFCGIFYMQTDTDPDQNAASVQGLHCLLTEWSNKILIKLKNTTQQHFEWNRTGPIDEWKTPFG